MLKTKLPKKRDASSSESDSQHRDDDYKAPLARKSRVYRDVPSESVSLDDEIGVAIKDAVQAFANICQASHTYTTLFQTIEESADQNSTPNTHLKYSIKIPPKGKDEEKYDFGVKVLERLSQFLSKKLRVRHANMLIKTTKPGEITPEWLKINRFETSQLVTRKVSDEEERGIVVVVSNTAASVRDCFIQAGLVTMNRNLPSEPTPAYINNESNKMDLTSTPSEALDPGTNQPKEKIMLQHSAAPQSAPTEKPASPPSGDPTLASKLQETDSDNEALEQGRIGIALARAAKESSELDFEIEKQRVKTLHLQQKLQAPAQLEKLGQHIAEQKRTLATLKENNTTLEQNIAEEQRLLTELEAENARKITLITQLTAKKQAKEVAQTKFSTLLTEAEKAEKDLAEQQRATAAERAKVLALEEKLRGTMGIGILSPSGTMPSYAQYSSTPRSNGATPPPSTPRANGAETTPTAPSQVTGSSSSASVPTPVPPTRSATVKNAATGVASSDTIAPAKRALSSSGSSSPVAPTPAATSKGQVEQPEKRHKGPGNSKS